MKTALLVVNLAARTVSQRLNQVIVKALSADLKLEVEETESRNHATALARDAASSGFDYVISFGGDGTMNEIANGLVGTETALAVLPGGMANVLCRSLGVPVDIVEATGHLINALQVGQVRKINVGRADGRYFVMSCGAGLDADTVKRVEANPQAKRRFREWFFLYSVLRNAVVDYRGRDPDIRLTCGETKEDLVLAIVTNLPQLTYWRRWPVVVAPRAKLESGLDVLGLKRLPMGYIPRIAWSVFKSQSHVGYKQVVYLNDVASLGLQAMHETFPLQVDGEFIGEYSEIQLELVSGGLNVLA